MITKRYINKQIYKNFSIVLATTDIITAINANDLSNLVTLRTLNVRKILTDRNALTALPDDPLNKVISKMDKDTIVPSKQFILSRTYPIGENAINFNPISLIKIQVNIPLHYSIIYKGYGSVNAPSRASTTVFRTTQMVKKFSIIFPLTNYWSSLCLTVIKPSIPARYIIESYPSVASFVLYLFRRFIGIPVSSNTSSPLNVRFYLSSY
jgi:hypothetical protein